MVMAIDRWLGKIPKGWTLVLAVVILCIIAVTDHFVGGRFGLTLFYLVPIFLIAWRFGRMVAVMTAVACALVWFAVDTSINDYSYVFERSWSIGTKAGVFVAFAIIVARVKYDITHQMRLNNELTEALAEVKKLSGLLPICAWCKKIRDQEGKWHPIEDYVTEHSDADFSHGICPECAASRHPAFRM
jgi:K+-sensing histidine kinase KdpD